MTTAQRTGTVPAPAAAPGRPRPKRVSVVIATRNRPDDVRHLLAAIEAGDTGLVHEVLLVDDASDTPLRLRADHRVPVRVLRNDRRKGAAASRNRAAESATGNVLAFLDDDARPLPDWFHVLGSALADDRAAVTGRVLPFDSGVVARARQYRYEVRYAQHAPNSVVTFFAGGNSAVWTDVFLEAGGFPDVVTASDNGLVERLSRSGRHVFFVPALRVAHRNSKGAGIAFREAWRAGRLAPRSSSAAALRRLTATARVQPWADDPAAAGLNLGLQAANSLATALPAS
ncbi:glycosyltransferase family 2 protein [Streptomyces sp. WMMC940]|uniref:glycosyltransferase family 2 protein n=1 Tax=Streptomyces sp. WMMC940 TaxID=3015153 RepID=UPI0022B648F5|nr:glycosyltransferase family 2 protein [Streptomyces sp. WMMC940]MCZ7456167.1 glycosyltransferase family 2 protein [Streptomyces sp. WMMC940]